MRWSKCLLFYPNLFLIVCSQVEYVDLVRGVAQEKEHVEEEGDAVEVLVLLSPQLIL